MRLSTSLTLVTLIAFLSGCVAASRTTPADSDLQGVAGTAYLVGEAVKDDLRSDVFVLASDEMAGREAGTAGEERAAAYIAERLMEAGIRPAGDHSGERSYFQEFPVRMVAFDTVHTRLVFHDSRLGQFTLGSEWVALPDFSPSIDADSVEVVYSGYGITAIDQGYDDYSGIDASGKIVVAVGGAPAHLDSIRTFGETFAPADLITKWISAVMQGATALVLVDFEPALASWTDFAVLARGNSMELVTDEESGVPVMPYLFLSAEAGNRLLDVLADTAAAASPVPLARGLSVTLQLAPQHTEGQSRNVVAYLPGSTASQEFVALGAHMDHLGTSEEGVFFGADDDASGVSAVLAVARAFASDAAIGGGPDRSILFVFHGAEEKGLLGSKFLTSSPGRSVFSELQQIVVQINLDMVGRESLDSLYVVGAARMSSRLGEIVEHANRDLGTDSRPLFVLDRAYDDPDDPERTFERSDHYRYAVQGIPVVFLTDGMGSNWAKGTETDDYHRVTDTPDKIDFEKLRRVALLAYEISRRTSQAQTRLPIDGEIPIDMR